ncbi:hypothetical protein VOLCADRAFT_108630 [Volvox carteri f. nagariensis]|uniref:Uncharacterized protein n=1 Tax=Volvox carteri f. nagariensis TaxID=3068 RepID=D8ULF2_VOLCA|nr:uncharacterized protein VOLCADRAFT_108630 [Volvox carteri f. nagariensis]EFJ39445.1 hypothetical protein VOLCADRAFT_108630 [Volvox carteri f. nagariensis]|eukprot:XP_002959488.1 hypothetical protein VOLCADRAFT_108630 [Volvox carteri f. nagariensis]
MLWWRMANVAGATTTTTTHAASKRVSTPAADDKALCHALSQIQVCSHRASLGSSDKGIDAPFLERLSRLAASGITCYDVDVAATADGQLVVGYPNHIITELRAAGRGAAAAAAAAAAAQGQPFQVDSVSWSEYVAAGLDQRHPLLQDVLRVFAEMVSEDAKKRKRKREEEEQQGAAAKEEGPEGGAGAGVGGQGDGVGGGVAGETEAGKQGQQQEEGKEGGMEGASGQQQQEQQLQQEGKEDRARSKSAEGKQQQEQQQESGQSRRLLGHVGLWLPRLEPLSLSSSSSVGRQEGSTAAAGGAATAAGDQSYVEVEAVGKHLQLLGSGLLRVLGLPDTRRLANGTRVAVQLELQDNDADAYDIFGPSIKHPDAALAEVAAAATKATARRPVVTWVVDSKEDATRAAHAGVGRIVSNDPRVMQSWLRSTSHACSEGAGIVALQSNPPTNWLQQRQDDAARGRMPSGGVWDLGEIDTTGGQGPVVSWKCRRCQSRHSIVRCCACGSFARPQLTEGGGKCYTCEQCDDYDFGFQSAEMARLLRAEQLVQGCGSQFRQMANSLLDIQERRLYSCLGFGSFVQYVSESGRIDIAPRYAQALVAAARFLRLLSATDVVPNSGRQPSHDSWVGGSLSNVHWRSQAGAVCCGVLAVTTAAATWMSAIASLVRESIWFEVEGVGMCACFSPVRVRSGSPH